MVAQWFLVAGTWFGCIVLAFSAYYVVKRMKAETYRALMQSEVEFEKMMIQFPEVDDRLYPDWSTADTDLDIRAERAALMLLDIYEMVCANYHEFGTIPDDHWELWKKMMKDGCQSRVIQEVWPKVKDLYDTEMAEIVEE